MVRGRRVGSSSSPGNPVSFYIIARPSLRLECCPYSHGQTWLTTPMSTFSASGMGEVGSTGQVASHRIWPRNCPHPFWLQLIGYLLMSHNQLNGLLGNDCRWGPMYPSKRGRFFNLKEGGNGCWVTITCLFLGKYVTCFHRRDGLSCGAVRFLAFMRMLKWILGHLTVTTCGHAIKQHCFCFPVPSNARWLTVFWFFSFYWLLGSPHSVTIFPHCHLDQNLALFAFSIHMLKYPKQLRG